MSPHHTMACGDVGGRVTDGACPSLAVEWPDPERAVAIRSQSDGCACVHETGWLWPLRIAKRMHEWATSEAERRNTVAYEHAISLGAFRTVLGVGVDEAGSISWRLCTRRLVDLAARRLVGPSARTGPVAEAPEVDLRSSAALRHQAELVVWCPGGADANSSFSATQVSVKKNIPKKLDLNRGCGVQERPKQEKCSCLPGRCSAPSTHTKATKHVLKRWDCDLSRSYFT